MPFYTTTFSVGFKMPELTKNYKVLIDQKQFTTECKNELMQYGEGILAAGSETVQWTALDHIIRWALEEGYIVKVNKRK